MADTWTPIDDPTAFQDDLVFEIDSTTKSIQVLVEQPIVVGENKSQFIKFQMERYYDAIDLTSTEVNILYESPSGYSDISAAVNREYSDEYIRFGWLVPYAACSEKGTLYFAVEFLGADYTLKTVKSKTEVLDSISGSSSVPEPTEQTWYIALRDRVSEALEGANSALSQVQEIVDGFGMVRRTDTAAGMIDENAFYVYTGAESGYTAGDWYYYDGAEWRDGGAYGFSDVPSDEQTAIAISDWLSNHPEATTTVTDRSVGKNKLVSRLQSTITSFVCNPEKIFREFLPADGYCKIQGGCFVDNATVIYALSKASPSDNSVKIVEVSLNSLSILRSTVLDLGHADDITYNPDTDELYVCPFYNYATQSAWTDLIIVNYSDLTIKNTITLNVPAYGVAYDRATNKTYVRDNRLNLYEADLDNETTTFIHTLPVTPSLYVKQGITAYNGFVSFSMYEPNVIYTIDVEDTSYINKTSLPYITTDCYLYGEHEFFDAIGDDFIFGTNLADYSGNYYQCNLWTNMPNESRQKSYIDVPNVIYVDSASTAVCPNGTEANAFPTLEEASLCDQVYNKGNLTFALKDGTYSGQLRGNHYVQGVGTSKDTVILNDIRVRYGVYRFYNLTLGGTFTIGENSFVYESKCTAGNCDAVGIGMLVNYNPFKSISCQNLSHAPADYTTVAPLNNCGTFINYNSIVALAQNTINNNEYFVIKLYVSTSYGGIMNQGFAQLFIDKTMAEKLVSTGLDTNVLFLNNQSPPAPFYCKIHCIISDGVFSVTASGTDTFTVRSVQVGM